MINPSPQGGLVFICGTLDGLILIAGRRHNTEDLIATVMAVEPHSFVYKGRYVQYQRAVGVCMCACTYSINGQLLYVCVYVHYQWAVGVCMCACTYTINGQLVYVCVYVHYQWAVGVGMCACTYNINGQLV